MRKKLMSLLLIGTMTTLLFTGCGGGSSEKETSKSNTQTAGTYKAKDLNGRTIKIGIWWDEYWDSDYKTLEDVEADGGSFSNVDIMQMKLDKVAEIEKKWNCKIDWVNLGWDGIKDSINTSVTAGTPDCDIYLTDLQFGISPVVNGYVQKISDYAPKESDILNDQNVLTRFELLGSDDYLFHESSAIPTGAMYMAYNAQVIDKLGLEAPEKLAEKGEWTWDKFEEYAKKCTQDTDGDGKVDMYGYGTVWTSTVQGFCASNNAEIASTSKEGLSDTKTVEALNFIDKLYNVDKVARPYEEDWDNNQLAFSSGKVAFTFAQPWLLIQESGNHDFDMRICPAPTGPSGDGKMTPSILTNNYMIPVGVEDATSVYEVFEELMNWYNGDTTYRDDPEYFESAFVDSDQVELATKLGNLANNDLWTSIDSAGAVNKVFYANIVNKESTVSQAVESYKQILQDELDSMKIK